MSMILMAKAMQIKVGNPSRKLVLIKLADNANDKGKCFPSYQHVADQCEMSRRSVINHIDALCEMGLVRKTFRDGEKGNSSNVYLLNLDEPIRTLPSENSALGVVKDLHQPSENSAPPPSENSAPRTSHSFEPVNEPKKEGFDVKNEPIPDWLNRDTWMSWIEYRKDMKKAIKTKQTFNLQIKFLAECFEEGHSPDEVINQSIANGWQGLFKPKNNPVPKYPNQPQGSWNTPEGWRDFI
ncbi:helix-turn-helix domain-containing protein [Providencia vermicola]|uniref:helix-turn-helix domain-containing protein n=1 Tax=Providencia vermicola TaxID=333965 RepID=UPI0032DBD5DC